jgi:alpha-mannosidase
VSQQFFTLDKRNLVLDTIKECEDLSSGVLILRLYEAYGGRGVAKLSTTLPIVKAHFCNILEDEECPVNFDNGILLIPFAPFKIITIKLEIAKK